MGMVHHSNYLIWFEAARSEFCRAHGIDYRQMEMDGLFLPVAEAHCRYISPAFYEDEIIIKTWVIELKRSILRIGYEALRDGALLAAGETMQVLVGKHARPKSFPPEIAALFTSPIPPSSTSQCESSIPEYLPGAGLVYATPGQANQAE